MTKYNTLNLKLSNSQLNELKPGIRNDTEVTLNLSWKVIWSSNGESNFPKTNQKIKWNKMKDKIKEIVKVIRSSQNRWILLKGTTKKKVSQEGGFFNFLRPLLTSGLPLMKNVLILLAKSVLIPLELRAAVSTKDASIQKKVFGSEMTALITSNREMEDITKIVKSFEESGFSETGQWKRVSVK